MSIINYLRKLVNDCPYLKEFYEAVSNDGGYVLKEVPVENPLVKNYINGDAIKNYEFLFMADKAYDIGVVENLIETEFDKHLLLYLQRKLKNKDLEDVDENRKIESIKASLTAEAVKENEGNYKYQISFLVTYYEREE